MTYCCPQCKFTTSFESALIMHQQLHHEDPTREVFNPCELKKNNTRPGTSTTAFVREKTNKEYKFAVPSRTSSATRLFDKLRARIGRGRALFAHPEEPAEDNTDMCVLSECTSKAFKEDATLTSARGFNCGDRQHRETFRCHLCSFEADRITVLDRHLLDHHKIGIDNLLKLVIAKTKDALSEDLNTELFRRQPYYKPQVMDHQLNEGEFVETVTPRIRIMKHAATNTEDTGLTNFKLITNELEKVVNCPSESNQIDLFQKMQTLNQYMCKFVDSSNMLKKVLAKELDTKSRADRTEHRGEPVFDLRLGEYECDIFDVPRWRCMQEAGNLPHPHYYRQPRYHTVPKPVYHTVRGSNSNWRGDRGPGARRIYLPENEWGTSSAESMVFVRNPRYNTSSYYPNEVIERQFRRDLRYPDGYYSRRPSSIYMDDDEMENYQATRYRTTSYGPKKPTKLVRKVTRKLSPIFRCDCAPSSNVKHLNTPNMDTDSSKDRQSHLSKEANNLYIFKILSLLRKAEEENDDLLSSLSLLQNIHDLDCRTSKSVEKLVTQRVQISPKMPKQKRDDPSEKFRDATSVRSKLEALVSALKQYEKEKRLNDIAKDFFSSDIANDPKYNNIIPSDPPSSSIDGKDKRSSITIVGGGKQKDIVLQTEKPKTSNKNVCGTIKTKKDNMVIERKSLRSRLSWKKREGAGVKLSNDGSKERLTYKIGSFLGTKQSFPEKEPGKQGQANNKAGLMISIGGNTKRKKPKPPKEKNKDKMPTTWIRKFLSTKDSKNNNIHLRWNNRAFYTKSSSTIFELVNNVYKQLGIKDYAKSDDISVSDIKKVPKRNTHKSKSRISRSPNKPKYKQKLKAYMMPQTIVPGPVFMPRNITHCNTHVTENVVSNTRLGSVDITKSSFCKLPSQDGFNEASCESSKYVGISLPNDFFDPDSIAKDEGLRMLSCDEQVYDIIQCETIPPDAVETSIIGGYGFNILKKHDLIKDVYMVQQSHSLCFTKRDIGEIGIESRPNKSLLQIRDFPDQDTASLSFTRRSCSLLDKIMGDEYQNWMPLGSYSIPFSDICKDSNNTVSILDPNASTISVSALLENVDNEIETIIYDDMNDKVNNKLSSKNTKELFRTKHIFAFCSNPIRWQYSAIETISDSLISISNRKPDMLSMFWYLFWGYINTPQRKRKRPPQNLSLVKSPQTVSEPNLCSNNPQKRYQLQHLWSSPSVLRTVKVEIPKKSLKHSSSLVHALLTEKDKIIEEKPPIPSTSSEVIKFDGSAHNTIPRLTELSEKASVLHKVSVPIKFTEFQGNNVKPDVPLKSKKPSRLIELRRSNLIIQNKMKFVTTPSAPILKQDLRQLQLLFIDILNVKQGFVHLKYKSPVEPQPQNYSQSTRISCIKDLQDESLKSDVDKGQEKNCGNSLAPERVNNSIHTLSTEITPEVVVKDLSSSGTMPSLKDQDTAKTLKSKTKRNQHGGVRNSVNKYSNKIDSGIVIKGLHGAKTLNSKTKGTNHVTYVSHIPALKNDVTSSKSHYLDFNKSASMKLSLKITKGDKITKISIKKRDKKKVDSTKLNQTDFQVTADRMHQSTNTIPNKEVRVFINITNISPKKVNQANKKASDKATKTSSDVHNYTTSDISDSQHNSEHNSLRSHSLSKSHTYMANMCAGKKLPVYVVEATSPNSIYGDLIAADQPNCIDSYLNNISAKNGLKQVLNITAGKTDHNNLQHVVEIERTLNAMMMLKASEFAELADMYDLASETNKTNTSLGDKMLSRKELVKYLSALKIIKRNTDDLEDNSKSSCNKVSYNKLESGDSCSRCNVLTRTLNTYRLVDGCKPSPPLTTFNFDEKANIAANYNTPHLVNPVMQKPCKAPETCSFNTDNDDVGMTSGSKKNKLNSPNRNGTLFQKSKPIIWYCGKKPNKKKRTKKLDNKEDIKELKEIHNDDAIVLTYIDSCMSRKSSFSKYKVNLKNVDSLTMKKDNSEINKVDILQSSHVKKAVLQIYSETVTNDGYLVAKIPKYLRL